VTDKISPTVDFFARLRKIDEKKLKLRDTMVLWAVARHHGLMGQEIAKKLGYPSRSHIQDGIRRLLEQGLIEDRRREKNQQTPNQLYITDAGTAFLNETVPA